MMHTLTGVALESVSLSDSESKAVSHSETQALDQDLDPVLMYQFVCAAPWAPPDATLMTI